MCKRSKGDEGNILLVVIILFAVVLILGTGLLGVVSNSQRYAIKKVNQQQAYYAAKSVVDATAHKLMKLPSIDQKDYIEPRGKLLNAVSEDIVIQDSQGKEWICKVEIKEDSLNDEVHIIGEAFRPDIEGRIIGVIDRSLATSYNSHFFSHNDFNVSANDGLEVQDIVAEGGAINLTSTEDLIVENIYAHGSIHLASTAGKVIVKGEMVSRGGEISINGSNGVEHADALFKALGGCKVNGIPVAYSVVGTNEAFPETIIHPVVPPDVIQVGCIGKTHFNNLVCNEHNINGDVYVRSCEIHGKSCLVTQFPGATDGEVHLNASKKYIFRMNGSTFNIVFGRKNVGGSIQEAPIDGDGNTFMLYTGTGDECPYKVEFNNNTNITYLGYFRPENGSLNIIGDTEQLSFGGAKYIFKRYEE